jgi:hypothetical protein
MRPYIPGVSFPIEFCCLASHQYLHHILAPISKEPFVVSTTGEMDDQYELSSPLRAFSLVSMLRNRHTPRKAGFLVLRKT